MSLALCATGYFIYLDLPETPNAVVACVIIFNAAFGFRLVFTLSRPFPLLIWLRSWGPLPWLYPPEVMFSPISIARLLIFLDHAPHCTCKRSVIVNSDQLGVQHPRR